MNKIQAKEFLPMVKALADGKIIQIKDKYDEWKDLKAPSFCEEVCNYRIKPQLKLVPFTFKDSGFLLGKIFKAKDSKYFTEMIWKVTDCINNDHIFKNFKEFLRLYEFDDGSPCGKYVEE